MDFKFIMLGGNKEGLSEHVVRVELAQLEEDPSEGNPNKHRQSGKSVQHLLVGTQCGDLQNGAEDGHHNEAKEVKQHVFLFYKEDCFPRNFLFYSFLLSPMTYRGCSGLFFRSFVVDFDWLLLA